MATTDGGEQTRAEVFLRGARDVSPTLLGVVPFGLIAGFTAIEIGLDLVHAVGFSAIIFAGAAQLAALDLLGSGAHIAVIIATALIINSRMLMYSASISPYLAHEPLRRRASASYLLVDQAYALGVVRYRTLPGAPHRWAYFMGAGFLLWVSWQSATIVGAFVGGAIPAGIPLAFAVPLTFLVLLIPNATDRPTIAAAVVAAVVATAAAPLPANLGMPLGTVVGIAVGSALALAGRQ